MPDFYFKIGNGVVAAPAGPIELPDEAAARTEAAAVFADLARDIVADLAARPVWEVEVHNNAGRPVFRIRFLAEAL